MAVRGNVPGPDSPTRVTQVRLWGLTRDPAGTRAALKRHFAQERLEPFAPPPAFSTDGRSSPCPPTRRATTRKSTDSRRGRSVGRSTTSAPARSPVAADRTHGFPGSRTRGGDLGGGRDRRGGRLCRPTAGTCSRPSSGTWSSGTRPPARPSACWSRRCTTPRSPCRPTGGRWRSTPPTRSTYGTCPGRGWELREQFGPAGETGGPGPRPRQRSPGHRLPPRRPGARLGRLRSDDQTLGHGHRRGAVDARRPLGARRPLAFTPDGNTLISADQGGTVRLWRSAPAEK